MSSRYSQDRKHQRSESSSLAIIPERSKSHPPAQFWDNLSKIWLTTGALRELDRRNRSAAQFYHSSKKEREHLQFAPEFLRDCSPSQLEEIKSLAESGGPDLTDLRNCPLPQTLEPRQTSSRVQKLQADHLLSETAENTKTTATSAYSRNFEQNLVEHGVYPRGHEIKGKSLPEPSNVEEIREILFRPRESLILESDFRKFQRAEVRASKEKDVITSVIPIFDGEINDDPKCAGGDYLFSNLAPLTDGSLAVAKPDHHFGVRPEDINRQIRDELNHLIIPSTQSDLAICQSFFLELKGPDGTTAVVRRQACYDGALGARAMQALRCYGQKLSYDNKAYVITSAYYSGNLEIYATHVAKSTRRDGRPIYIMTLLDSFSMIGSLRAFRQGLTAYRNAHDWTKERRGELIEAANKLVEGAHSQNSSSAQNQTPELVSNMGNSTSIGSTRPASSFIEDTQRKSKRVKIHSSESPGDTFDDDEEVAYPPSERGSKLDTNMRMA